MGLDFFPWAFNPVDSDGFRNPSSLLAVFILWLFLCYSFVRVACVGYFFPGFLPFRWQIDA